MKTEEKLTGLQLLRKPFEAHQISKLPKPTKQQTEEVKNDFSKGIRCQECGGWHHPKVVHLDYVGHAALTDRLLDCDINWNWEPVKDAGLPVLDNGGMWIKLTVCGVSRLGYGHPDGKTGGDAIKETIGDALRNAAMRFGAALDLWHKGDLHKDESDVKPKEEKPLGQQIDDAFKTANLRKDPENFVIDFGTKFKGKKLSEVDLVDIDKSVEYWEGKKKQGSIAHTASAFLLNAYAYLEAKNFYPPTKGE